MQVKAEFLVFLFKCSQGVPAPEYLYDHPINPDELDLLDILDQTSVCSPADFWRIFLALIKRNRARDRTNPEDER
jgi:hypothetical protein